MPLTCCLASMCGAPRMEHVQDVRRVARTNPACDQTGNGAPAAAPRLSLHTGHALRVGGLPGQARAHQGGWQQTGAVAWLPAQGVLVVHLSMAGCSVALQPPLADNVLYASWKSMRLTKMHTEERSHFLEELWSIYLNDGPQPRVAKNPMPCVQRHALRFQE